MPGRTRPFPLPRRRLLLLGVALLALGVAGASTARAQVCTGDLYLATQAEVNAFDCAEVTGNLRIGDPDRRSDIVRLDALTELQTLGGFLSIADTDALSNFDGLGRLASVGSYLFIGRNAALTNLSGLARLTSVGSTLTIQDNDALVSLRGLDALASVGVSLALRDNDALPDLRGLGGLTEIGGGLFVEGHARLASLDGLAVPSATGSSVFIADNPALANLDGLRGLTAVGRTLVVSGNDALANLDGLQDLATVAYTLTVADNDALVSLDGLDRLATVVHNVDLRANAALADVDALRTLTSVGNQLLVTDNPVLARCGPGLGPLLTADGVRAGSDLRGNAVGCNSIAEILATYTDMEDEDQAAAQATTLAEAYPNPAAGPVALTYTLAEPGEVTLAVYDLLGRRVAVVEQGPRTAGAYEATWTGTGLPAGPYVLRLDTGAEVHTRRLTLVR